MCDASSASRSREDELREWLERVPGVQPGSVSTKPLRKGELIGDHGVSYKLRVDGRLKSRRTACNSESRPTLADALASALDAVHYELGASIVDSCQHSSPVHGAEHVPPPQPAYTAEELEWLVDWCESHEDPSTLTAEQCEAALAQRRQASGKTAASVFHEAQLRQARL